jgi:dTDP-glucose pyrophosphorylase
LYDEEVADIAAALTPSARGELEISDLNYRYLRQRRLELEMLGRASHGSTTGRPESLLHASEFVATIEARLGLKIACPEEITWRQTWIDLPIKLTQLAQLQRGADERDWPRLESCRDRIAKTAHWFREFRGRTPRVGRSRRRPAASVRSE